MRVYRDGMVLQLWQEPHQNNMDGASAELLGRRIHQRYGTTPSFAKIPTDPA